MNLEGRTVAITGAARGLGAAMAARLTGLGARIALIDRDEDALNATAGKLSENGGECRQYPTDVADESQVVRTFERIVADFGALDVAVANAGVIRDAVLVRAKGSEIVSRLSMDDWQSVIDINLTGVFLCGREAATRMIELGRPGLIVNISSISRHGNFGQTNYAAAKAGVVAMTVVWAKELARHSIRCNAIAPGFIATEIVSSMDPTILQRAIDATPVGRAGDPDEIAHTVQFLIENDFINGRVIDADGGLRI